MKQFMDIFSLPEMTLLCCVNDFFMKHNIDYEPVHLYKDVKVSLAALTSRSLWYLAQDLLSALSSSVRPVSADALY